jgi:hypothetical protein
MQERVYFWAVVFDLPENILKLTNTMYGIDDILYIVLFSLPCYSLSREADSSQSTEGLPPMTPVR